MITCRNSGEEDNNVSDIQRQVVFGKEVKIYRPVGGWGSYLWLWITQKSYNISSESLKEHFWEVWQHHIQKFWKKGQTMSWDRGGNVRFQIARKYKNTSSATLRNHVWHLCLGESEAKVAILDFELFWKETTLLQDS